MGVQGVPAGHTEAAEETARENLTLCALLAFVDVPQQVAAKVVFVVATLGEPFEAEGTPVRLVTRVHPFVNAEFALIAEPLLARLAVVGQLRGGVETLFVPLERCVVAEGLVALVAAVRALSPVLPHVDEQQAVLAERLPGQRGRYELRRFTRRNRSKISQW